MSKLVERFGKNDEIWEEVSYTTFRDQIISSATYDPICAERDPPEEIEYESEDEEECEYEQERQKRIQDNHLELFLMVTREENYQIYQFWTSYSLD
ncbi:hypothetical protein HDV00_003232 [Rhizophlyctis rosea]|nr:hypothetical protein HDV00_003232 [Rhizophlyctis rosea]